MMFEKMQQSKHFMVLRTKETITPEIVDEFVDNNFRFVSSTYLIWDERWEMVIQYSSESDLDWLSSRLWNRSYSEARK